MVEQFFCAADSCVQGNRTAAQSTSSSFGSNGTVDKEGHEDALLEGALGPGRGVARDVERVRERVDRLREQSTSSSFGSNGTVDWTCQNLRCTCIPGTTFCGAAAPHLHPLRASPEAPKRVMRTLCLKAHSVPVAASHVVVWLERDRRLDLPEPPLHLHPGHDVLWCRRRSDARRTLPTCTR
jgi:hypothetical protein